MENNYIHWKNLTDSPYLGHWSITPGEDIVATISGVTQEKIVSEGGKSELCPVLHFGEKEIKPMVLNSTNAKTIEKLYNTPNVYEWVGKKIQIFATTTNFGAKHGVPCLRIRPNIPASAEPEYHCSVCGKVISKDVYSKSVAKYGKAYCSKECLDKETKGEDLLG